MKKHTTRSLRKNKFAEDKKIINMLTCYDFQTAKILNETALDLILVGDSLGNVILGYDTTVEVSLDEMRIFSAAVKRGAPDKFVIADLPFGSYATFEKGIENGLALFQQTKVEALKLEGANPVNYQIIERLTQMGVPVMGHIGLMPQSVHAQGGYYKHGKTEESKTRLIKEAKALQAAGCFSIVLECVDEDVATEITNSIDIPTIGIGSGKNCDGQVLVLNDLLGMTPHTPSFVTPIANMYQTKKELISSYLN
jgi:3-methyl-2-oxobutanoate hydroxymethyltransferase